MAERKSGPVKPPVIDMKARSADADREGAGKTESPAKATPEAPPEPPPEAPVAGAAPESAAAEPLTEPARPTPPPRPPARLAMPWSAISIAAIGGAMLGTALTYGLVTLVPLPDHRPVIADPGVRLDAQDASLSELATRLGALEEQGKRTQVSLDATIAQLDKNLTDVRQSVAAIPASAPVDLAPLEARLQSLEDRIDAVGAGASTADAAALAQTISGLETGLRDLRTRLDASDKQVAAAEGALAAMQQQVTEAKSAITAQNTQLGGAGIAPVVRLPLLVSGLESAFATGRPYADELTSLTALLPELEIPPAIRGAADAGLPRPDAVSARFNRKVPDMLAGRSATGNGDLGEDVLAWMKGVLALRPAEELEGQTPEAVMSRLESAVGRGDFVAASALLDQLPPSMQGAAGDTATDIRALAVAASFADGLRAKALAPVAEAAQ